jgi:hypothetical protein
MKSKLLPLFLAAIVGAVALAGCVVYQDGYPRDERHPYRQYPPAGVMPPDPTGGQPGERR